MWSPRDKSHDTFPVAHVQLVMTEIPQFPFRAALVPAGVALRPEDTVAAFLQFAEVLDYVGRGIGPVTHQDGHCIAGELPQAPSNGEAGRNSKESRNGHRAGIAPPLVP